MALVRLRTPFDVKGEIGSKENHFGFTFEVMRGSKVPVLVTDMADEFVEGEIGCGRVELYEPVSPEGVDSNGDMIAENEEEEGLDLAELKAMSKAELLAYAEDTLGTSLDKREAKDVIIIRIQELEMEN